MAVVATLILLAAGGATYLASDSVLFGGLAVLVLFMSLNRFFLPSRFELDEEGVTARYPFTKLRRKWSDVNRLAADDRVAVLFDGKRAGIQLLLGRHRKDVIERLRQVVPKGIAHDHRLTRSS